MMRAYVTATGALMLPDERGVYKVLRCADLVRVASGNPEPDSFADTFRDVECGSIVRTVGGRTTHTRCDSGHDHVSWEDPDYAADQEAWAHYERTHGDDIHEGNSLAHVC